MVGCSHFQGVYNAVIRCSHLQQAYYMYVVVGCSHFQGVLLCGGHTGMVCGCQVCGGQAALVQTLSSCKHKRSRLTFK